MTRRVRSLWCHALVFCTGVFMLAGGRQTRVAAATEVILRAASGAIVGTAWSVVADASAAGGTRLANPDIRVAKVAPALAAPASYVELTFSAAAGTPYRLWMRGKAQGNSYENDSVHVQFSDSVSANGAATWRIGTTSATSYILEEAANAGLSGWGWQDNGFGTGVLGPLVYFQSSGMHTMRIQAREDGLSIDQVVLSPAAYLQTSPGATKNDATILIGGTPPPTTVTLAREPYLHQVTDQSAIIVWASQEAGPASAKVDGRTFAAATTFYPRTATGLPYDYYQHEAAITGLAASALHSYDVYVGNARGTPGTDRFRTAPARGTGSVTFVVTGDSGTGSAEQKALAALLKSATFDIMLHAGDIAYGNDDGTGDASHQTYQRWFFDIYRDTLRRKPLFPSMGNHDARASNGWGRAYRDVYVLPDDAGTGPHTDHAERYYSFDYGPVHFVVLDTELAFSAGSRRAAQLAWLDADLAASTMPWKIALFHRPPFSSGEHGSGLDVRGAFVPLFEQHGVQIALSGHDHDYERLVPWREGNDLTRQAVVYLVSGAGGAPLYQAGMNRWTAVARTTYHYVKGQITGCVARFEAIDKSGATIDAYTFDRCQQAADQAVPSVAFVQPLDGAMLSGTVTVQAAADDDTRVEKVDLWVDGTLRGIDPAAPYELAWNTAAETPGKHTLQLRAYDIDGRQAARSISVTVAALPPGGATDIVIRAVDVPPGAVVGDWTVAADATAAGGKRLWNPNRGASRPPATAPPVSYFDVAFDALAGVPYHLWLRMRAESNSYSNDSVYVWPNAAAVPFSVILEEGSGAGVHGWGWNDASYGGAAAPISFPNSGRQTLRIGVREDGVSIDQIVLSPETYLTTRPGGLKDDGTIVPQ